MPPATRRAPALSPEERRRALILATLPLVLAHGTDVSTRQIAEVAGVAEGTIFRAFPTKDDLIDAVVLSAFEPSGLIDSLTRIDRAAPLRDRLVAAVELMQERSRQLAHLLHALAARGPAHRPTDREHHRWLRADEARVVDALALLVEPGAHELRCSARDAARRLRLMTIALSNPRLAGDDPLPAAEIVSMLLDGIRQRPGTESRGR